MNTVQILFLNEAYDNLHLLSEWEASFIQDLMDKPATYVISSKQNEIINRIQKKLTSSFQSGLK